MAEPTVTEIFAGGQVYAVWSDYEFVRDQMNGNYDISFDPESAAIETPTLVEVKTIYGTRAAINPAAVTSVCESRLDTTEWPESMVDRIQWPEGVER